MSVSGVSTLHVVPSMLEALAAVGGWCSSVGASSGVGDR